MKPIFSSLRGRVVVIVGASSGIGRAAALAFAQEGAHLVLAARRERPLRKLAGECARLRVHAVPVPTEVTDATAVEALASTALKVFGRIDIWINNVGVGLFGPFAGADVKAHRRVVETNLFGTMNGCAAVLPHFLRQGRGVLITTVSIGAFAPVPFATAYTASKFGLRGFLAGLRQELAHVPRIKVCGIFPSAVDTPGYQHAGNVSGGELRAPPLLLRPEAVARAMVDVALKPRPEVSVGWSARAAKLGYGLAPLTTERIAGSFMRTYLKQAKPARRTQGNLFLPVSAGSDTSGGWLEPRERSWSPLGYALAGVAVVGAGLLAGSAAKSAWTKAAAARHDRREQESFVSAEL